jgi:hypothetical protein
VGDRRAVVALAALGILMVYSASACLLRFSGNSFRLLVSVIAAGRLG